MSWTGTLIFVLVCSKNHKSEKCPLTCRIFVSLGLAASSNKYSTQWGLSCGVLAFVPDAEKNRRAHLRISPFEKCCAPPCRGNNDKTNAILILSKGSGFAILLTELYCALRGFKRYKFLSVLSFVTRHYILWS